MFVFMVSICGMFFRKPSVPMLGRGQPELEGGDSVVGLRCVRVFPLYLLCVKISDFIFPNFKIVVCHFSIYSYVAGIVSLDQRPILERQAFLVSRGNVFCLFSEAEVKAGMESCLVILR